MSKEESSSAAREAALPQLLTGLRRCIAAGVVDVVINDFIMCSIVPQEARDQRVVNVSRMLAAARMPSEERARLARLIDGYLKDQRGATEAVRGEILQLTVACVLVALAPAWAAALRLAAVEVDGTLCIRTDSLDESMLPRDHVRAAHTFAATIVRLGKGIVTIEEGRAMLGNVRKRLPEGMRIPKEMRDFLESCRITVID